MNRSWRSNFLIAFCRKSLEESWYHDSNRCITVSGTRMGEMNHKFTWQFQMSGWIISASRHPKMWLSEGNHGHGRRYSIHPDVICLPESSKGLEFDPLNHQKQTWGLKFDTQTEGLGTYLSWSHLAQGYLYHQRSCCSMSSMAMDLRSTPRHRKTKASSSTLPLVSCRVD